MASLRPETGSTGIAVAIIRALRRHPFAPRFGFSYRLSNKTVIRGGYGVFFDSSETREIDDSGDLYPFVIRASNTPTADPTLPKNTDNLFVPASTLQPVAVGSNGGTTFPAGGQFIAVIISEKSAKPIRAAVVGFRAARAGTKHHAGAELRGQQGDAPAGPRQCQPADSRRRTRRCARRTR